jgi:beta-lactamase regulating signal transducer with metallopeptidase domain
MLPASDPRLVSLVLEVAVESLLLTAVALTLTWFMRRFSAAQRHLFIVATAVALLILPLLSLVVPARSLGMLATPMATEISSPPATPGHAPETGRTAENGLASADRPARQPGSKAGGGSRPAWITPVITVWAVGSVLLLLYLIGSRLLGWWVASRAPELAEQHLSEAVQAVAQQQQLSRPISVATCNFFKVPFVSGTIRPRLVLPIEAGRWPADRVRAILHHEVAHIRRRDVLSQLIAQLVCCLYWFNPLVWVLERRLFIERERACDDVALADNIPASEYAGHLMEVMEEMGSKHDTLWVTAAMAEGTDFKDRILSALDPGARRHQPKALYTSIVIAFTVLLVLPLAALSPWSDASAKMAVFNSAAVPEIKIEIEADTDTSADIEPPATNERDRSGAELSTLLTLLQSRDAGLREHAATALGRIGSHEATKHLVTALGDDEAKVREHVASALGDLGDPTAVAPLARTLLEDADPRVREHAASALGQLADASALGALVRALREDDNARVREHAAEALADLGNPDALEPLVAAMFEDGSDRVREHAASALGKLGSPEAFDPLVKALFEDQSPRVRAHAAEALGWLGDPRALEPLTRALEDPSDEVRKKAVIAIGMLQ